jgi:hypothetical protein
MAGGKDARRVNAKAVRREVTDSFDSVEED